MQQCIKRGHAQELNINPDQTTFTAQTLYDRLAAAAVPSAPPANK